MCLQSSPPPEPAAVAFRVIHFHMNDLGMHSLVGVSCKSYPYEFGNYFSFLNPDNRHLGLIERLNGPRVVNMWSENLSYLRAEKKIEQVRCLVFGEAPNWVAFVEDDAIPVSFTNSYLTCPGHSQEYMAGVETYSGLSRR